MNKTKVRVERFVQRRGSALQSEIQFLGQKTMQVKFPVVQAILQDLVRAGLVKVTTFMLYLMPAFLVILFLGGIGPGPVGILLGLLKFFALLAAFILIRSLSPRLRTDQAIKLFWKGGLGLGLVALALALWGW